MYIVFIQVQFKLRHFKLRVERVNDKLGNSCLGLFA